MKKNELPPCPVATLLVLIGTKWKVLIVRDLLGGTKRFKELQRSVGCSHNSLKYLSYFKIPLALKICGTL